MTYGHLHADCLYTGISSGPDARCRVWEAFPFLPCVQMRRTAVQAVWNAERTESGGGREIASRSEDGQSYRPIGVDDADEHRFVVVVSARRRNDEVDAETDRTADSEVVLEHRPRIVIRISDQDRKRTCDTVQRLRL